ncbi:MAG: hypothetical protein HUU50_13275 [Candidatus Brocadiae bacterium]|nr:hypothetical protein [Candidatus Brocadiia bacterium]
MGRSFSKWIWQAIVFTFFTAVVFTILNWLNWKMGTATLWVSGVVIYWVLSGITILPWNVYFAADEALHEILETERKGKQCNEEDKVFARKARRNAGIIAVFIHVFTALVFFLLALFTDLGLICYLAAAAAIALTVLRPSMRAMEHIVSRLQNIGRHARFPRDDIYDLKERILKLESYDKTAEQLQKEFHQKTEELKKEYEVRCTMIQEAYEKPVQRIREFEKLLDYMQKEIIDKIDSFDDAIAFKTAWDRVAPELAKIFHSSRNL